jgi:arsenate reductase
MAEGLARHRFGEAVTVQSAGSAPSHLNPLATKAMAAIGIDISRQYSKSVTTVEPADIDLVITLCAEEECPVFLGDAQRRSWAMPDPDRKHEPLTEAARLAHFVAARDAIDARLALLSCEG